MNLDVRTGDWTELNCATNIKLVFLHPPLNALEDRCKSTCKSTVFHDLRFNDLLPLALFHRSRLLIIYILIMMKFFCVLVYPEVFLVACYLKNSKMSFSYLVLTFRSYLRKSCQAANAHLISRCHFS